MARLRRVRSELSVAVRAPSTMRGYAADWDSFQAWCNAAGRDYLPASAETVSLFLTSEIDRGCRITTVERRICSIAWFHREAGLPPVLGSEIRAVVNGARRKLKQRPECKTPVTVAELSRMVSALAGSAAGVRDAAFLLFGFASAMRRAEIVALNWEDLEFSAEGVAVTVRSSKTDQLGLGCVLGVRRAAQSKLLCPVGALEAWRALYGPGGGPVFVRVLNGHVITGDRLGAANVSQAVKRSAIATGLDPCCYGAHSLRAGMVTAALVTGADLVSVMERSRHKSVEMVRRYFRPSPFGNDPLARAL